MVFARAETCQTTQGDRYEGILAGVYGPLAALVGNAGTQLVSLEILDDTALGRVADYLAQPKAAAPWSKPATKVAKALRGRLQVMRDGMLAAFDPGPRPEPELYLIYFGAHWCPPCRAFSPELVRRYPRLKQLMGDRFEVVFVSSDRDASEQKQYVHEVGMTWPVLEYSSLGDVAVVERWAGPGIPCLVALTRDGDVIFHSYHGTEYIGAQAVLDQFETFVRGISGESDGIRRATHRLAVLQHLRATANGSSVAKPYLISLDRSRYQTLEVKSLTAQLEIDEFGCVQSARFEPGLPAVLDYQLVQDAGTWLFLPAIENGHPKRIKATLPLAL